VTDACRECQQKQNPVERANNNNKKKVFPFFFLFQPSFAVDFVAEKKNLPLQETK
jgi:hypothetical protein